jgi:biopolymer transport protein ExbD
MIKRGAISDARGKILLEKKRLWLTAVLVIGYSISLYLFFLYCRELFRYQTITGDRDNMLVLTSTQNYFYNFFLAGLATLTGFSFGANSLILTQFRLRGFIRYSIVNDFSGLQWYSVYILTKLGFFFGILCWSAEVHQAFSLYEEYWVLFPLILIVLFFNQWIKFRLYFRNSLRLMMAFALGFFLFVSVVAAIPFFDYKSFNNAVLKNTINYNYSIDLPNTEISIPIERRSLTQELSIGFPKVGKNDSAVVIAKDNLNGFSKEDLKSWLIESKKDIDDVEVDRLSISLKADKNLSMNSIKSFMDQLREVNILTVHFITSNGSGIGVLLQPTFQELTNDTLYWHPSILDLEKEIRGFKNLKIRLTQNSIFLNDSLCSPTKLAGEIKSFIEINRGNYLINLDTDNISSYQGFIQILDATYASIFSSRKEFASKGLSKEYNYKNNYDRALLDTLGQVYPIRIRFLNEKEKTYLDEIQM